MSSKVVPVKVGLRDRWIDIKVALRHGCSRLRGSWAERVFFEPFVIGFEHCEKRIYATP